MTDDIAPPGADWKFKMGDTVRKPTGSWWQGRVVGTYSTRQTPRGYCVQMQTPEDNGPVQFYPETALDLVQKAATTDAAPDTFRIRVLEEMCRQECERANAMHAQALHMADTLGRIEKRLEAAGIDVSCGPEIAVGRLIERLQSKPTWFWRQLDPDEAGGSIHEALRFVPDFVVCHLGASISAGSFFAARVPVLDRESDDTEELTAETEDECRALVQQRIADLRAAGWDGGWPEGSAA